MGLIIMRTRDEQIVGMIEAVPGHGAVFSNNDVYQMIAGVRYFLDDTEVFPRDGEPYLEAVERAYHSSTTTAVWREDSPS